jgi:hypothetical protein
VADPIARAGGGAPGDPPRTRWLHRGSLAQADVRLVSSASGPVVVKDYSGRPLWLRWVWGRWLCRRERAALRTVEERLEGPAWLPRLVEGAGPDAFAMEYRPGRPLSRAIARELPATFVDELEGAVRALHRAGVVHLDLSHRSNVLVDDAGHLVLLDFASALRAPPGGVRHRLLVGLLGWIDRRAVRKWRRKLTPRG